MNILVIDAQGGGIGAQAILALRSAGVRTEIIAAGTNALATNAMLKAGADSGATGENAVVYNAARADIILGPIGILLANAMHGEISPAMAAAVSGADAKKILVPSAKCAIYVAGTEQHPLDAYIKDAVRAALSALEAHA